MTVAKRSWGQSQRGEDEITCSLVPSPLILIDVKAKQKIHLLMEEYTNREWLAYLIGYQTEAGNYIIEDISVPPHKDSSYGSAEAEPFNIPDGCVGVIHSHHGMGAFHSGTDQTYVDRNYPVSVTVAKGEGTNLKYSTVSVTETPCGKPIKLECEVKYLAPEPDFDVEDWVNKAKADIDKGQWKGYVTSYGGKKDGGFGTAAKEAEDIKLPSQQPPLLGNGERVITHQMVRDVRKAIHDSRGIVLTRSEIEDILEKNPLAFAGIGGEYDGQVP